MTKSADQLPVVGWREWVGLPELGIAAIKTKLDTGARTSSLHAFDIERFRRKGRLFVRFKVHPLQRRSRPTVQAEAEVQDYRIVRSSSGHETQRPVICTDVQMLNQIWTIELTLANRDQMGFRMLLGREALRGRCLVDAGGSFHDHTHRPGNL